MENRRENLLGDIYSMSQIIWATRRRRAYFAVFGNKIFVIDALKLLFVVFTLYL